MSLQRFSKWLLTENGRNFVFGTSVTGVLGIFSSYMIPNTFLLDKYVEIVHLYENGMSVSLSNQLKERFEKAMDLADVPPDEKKLYKPFHVVAFDVFNAGNHLSKYGCRIGIPQNFTYKDVDTIPKHKIKINGESVMWALPEAKELLESLVFSEDAQLYAMAREIKMTLTAKLPFDAFYATFAAISTYAVNTHFNHKLDLYARPLGLRLVLYTLVSAFALGNFFLAKDMTQIYYEKTIDAELKEKGEHMVRGGKEYYEKLLRRNIAFRRLMGKEGESRYTALGNENYLIRNKHIPLLQRKEFFEGKDLPI